MQKHAQAGRAGHHAHSIDGALAWSQQAGSLLGADGYVLVAAAPSADVMASGHWGGQPLAAATPGKQRPAQPQHLQYQRQLPAHGAGSSMSATAASDAAARSTTTAAAPAVAKAAALAAGGSAGQVALLRSPLQASGRRDPTDPSPRSGSLSWDDYFMALAFLSAERSKDPNKQVGAVIVNADHVILGIGYNGFPRGCCDSDLPWAKVCPRGTGNGLTASTATATARTDNDPLGTKYPYVVHAEANALLNKNAASVAGARVYVTMFPCNECAKLLIQAGITEVVYHEDKVQHLEHLAAAWPTSSSATASLSSRHISAAPRRGSQNASTQPAHHHHHHQGDDGRTITAAGASAGQARREARLQQAAAAAATTTTTIVKHSAPASAFVTAADGGGDAGGGMMGELASGAPSPAAATAGGSPCPVTPGVPLLPDSPRGSSADGGVISAGGHRGGGGAWDSEGEGEGEGSIGGAIDASPTCSTGWRAQAGTPQPQQLLLSPASPSPRRGGSEGLQQEAAAAGNAEQRQPEPQAQQRAEQAEEGVAPWSGFWPSQGQQQQQQQQQHQQQAAPHEERAQSSNGGGGGGLCSTGLEDTGAAAAASSSGQILSSWAREPGSGSGSATAAAVDASGSGIRVAAQPSDADVCYLASLRLLRLAGVRLRQHRLARPITVPSAAALAS